MNSLKKIRIKNRIKVLESDLVYIDALFASAKEDIKYSMKHESNIKPNDWDSFSKRNERRYKLKIKIELLGYRHKERKDKLQSMKEKFENEVLEFPPCSYAGIKFNEIFYTIMNLSKRIELSKIKIRKIINR